MIDSAEVLRSCLQLTPEIKRLAGVFASPEGVGRRYLLGRNEDSAALAKVIDIDGFIDDFAEPGIVWNNKPVFRRDEIPINAVIVNCVSCAKPITASKGIEKLRIAGMLAYADLCKMFPDRFCLPSFVLETRTDIRLNQARWESLSISLADDHSRQVLDDILKYRLTGDYGFMTAYSFRPKDQYFEDFLGLGANEVFVDGGGFDGDTTEEFCRRYPDYRKIYLFEPALNNIHKAKARLNGLRDIEFIQLGLSDSVGTLWFNPEAGSSSSVSATGSCQIDVTTLDQQVEGKVTFVKMDLEGWELKALEGSKRHILGDYPKLAIAVYHHPSHFWRIFEFVINLRQDYDVYLRHYTESWTETVMYFVPR